MGVMVNQAKPDTQAQGVPEDQAQAWLEEHAREWKQFCQAHQLSEDTHKAGNLILYDLAWNGNPSEPIDMQELRVMTLSQGWEEQSKGRLQTSYDSWGSW